MPRHRYDQHPARRDHVRHPGARCGARRRPHRPKKYGVHVLSRPREHVSVFQVFSLRDGKVFQSGDIDSFLHSKFDKPEVAKAEVMADINGTTSDALSGNVAVNFLDGFLALIGAGADPLLDLARHQVRGP